MSLDAQTKIRRAAMDALENRQLMSGSPLAWFDNGVLMMRGAPGSDVLRVTVSPDGQFLNALVNGLSPETVRADRVTMIRIDAGDGNNVVLLDSRVRAPAMVTSGSGRDRIETGQGNDTINSGGGNDNVDAGAGDDRVTVGGGNDLVFGREGNDTIHGSAGNDTIQAGGGADLVFGDAGDDRLVGYVNDLLHGGSGRNQIVSRPLRPAGLVAAVPPVGRVTQVAIVDTSTGKVIPGFERVSSGTSIPLAALPASVGFDAKVDGQVSNVLFTSNGASAPRLDNTLPFRVPAQLWYGEYQFNFQPAAEQDGLRRLGEVTVITLNFTNEQPSGAGIDSGSATPEPTPPPAPIPMPTPTDANAPVSRISVLDTNVPVGQAVHVNGLNSTLRSGQAEDHRFEWDFGDPGSKYNKMPGFNASHVYARPGTYTIRLTVTDPQGRSSVVSTQVTVTAYAKRQIFVAANGNDAGNGVSAEAPVRTLERAQQLLQANPNHVDVLLRVGDTFNLGQTFTIAGDNVTVSSFGSGADPIVRWTGPRNGFPLFFTAPTADGVTIRGLSVQSSYTNVAEGGINTGIQVAGRAITIVDNDFRNLSTAVNANGEPTGLLVQDNRSPTVDRLHSYFVWGAGSDLVIVGNSVKNSTREAIIRLNPARRVSICFNDLTNMDRRNVDPSDYDKNVITNQKGEYSYVAFNTINGPVAIGPLGSADGVNDRSARWEHSAWEGNRLNSRMSIVHGAQHITLRDNVMRLDDGQILGIDGWNQNYLRGNADIVIDSNTAINMGTQGRFLWVNPRVNGIVLTNNIYSAPRLVIGGWQSVAVWVNDKDLSSFTRVSGNLWPTAANATWWANGGVHYIGLGTYDREGHFSPSAWAAFPQVQNDEFSNVQITGDNSDVTFNGRRVGARLNDLLDRLDSAA